MPVQLVSATLNVSPSDPNKHGKAVGVQSAKWLGNACVRFTNEQGRKFQVGFVQVMEINVMQALYTRTKKTEVLKSGYTLPIRDGSRKVNKLPFYETPAAGYTIPNNDYQVHISMSDEPESDYDWWHNNDRTDPLTEFVMSMRFQTYVAARDITAGFQLTDPWIMHFLKQWTVTLDRRIEFNVVARAGGPKADLNETTGTKVEIINPNRFAQVGEVPNIRAPAESLLKSDKVANDAFEDVITPKLGRVISPGIQNIKDRFGG